MQLASFCK